MSFENPPMLNVLAVTVLLLTAFLYWTWRKRQAHILQFVRGRLLAQLTVGVSATRQKLRLALLVCAVAGVLLALARPRWGYTWEQVKQRGLDIVVAVDTSRSMLAEDISPNRLRRAKLAALALVPEAKTDRLGLVAFAGTAFLQCPLTLDDEAYRQSVNALDVGLIPQGGTALAESIRTALTAFKHGEENPKVVVLLTDGEDHEEGAVAAAQEAAKAGVRVFTIGIGTAQGEMLHTAPANGVRGYVRDPDGNVVKSHLNEDLLRQIAAAANGFYLPLRGANTIDVLYEQGLAPLLGRSKAQGAPRPLPAIKRPQPRFQWPLGLAILLLILEMFFPDRKLVKRPEERGTTTTQPELAGIVAACLCLAVAPDALGSSGKAWQLYQSHQYEPAWKEYQRLHERNPKDARLAFNAGVAAYQAKAYAEAVGLLNDSLLAPDLSLQQRAYYNLGNTQFRVGEQADEPGQKHRWWEEAIKDYENALKLHPKDADAQYNRDYVKKRLEELEKEQQKQPQKSDSKDQQDKQDSESKKQEQPQPKQDQSKPDQSKQNQSKPDQAKQDQAKQDQTKQDQAKKGQAKQDQAKNTPQAEPKNQAGKTNQTNAAEAAEMEGKMTPQQAQQLLDAQKNDEQVLIILPPEAKAARPHRFKDW